MFNNIKSNNIINLVHYTLLQIPNRITFKPITAIIPYVYKQLKKVKKLSREKKFILSKLRKIKKVSFRTRFITKNP